jgi:hypothetical protein
VSISTSKAEISSKSEGVPDPLARFDSTCVLVSPCGVVGVILGVVLATAQWVEFTPWTVFVDFSEDHYFVKASIRAARERLVFVTSFHHVGRELTGVMEATSFSRLESYEDSEDRESVDEKFFLCSMEPFVFTHRTNVAEIKDAFGRWLDQALAVAIKEHGDRL